MYVALKQNEADSVLVRYLATTESTRAEKLIK